MEFSFCETFYCYILLYYAQGDPLEALTGNKANYVYFPPKFYNKYHNLCVVGTQVGLTISKIEFEDGLCRFQRDS